MSDCPTNNRFQNRAPAATTGDAPQEAVEQPAEAVQ